MKIEEAQIEMQNKIYQKITVSLILTLFLSESIASFSILHDLDDSIILEARKAAVESYGYIGLPTNVNQIIEPETQVHVFRGSTGHSNILSGGQFQHPLGTVSIYSNKNRAFIAFHGSENLDDWVSDLLATKQDAPSNLRGKVHRGFHDVVQSGYGNLVNILTENIENPNEIEFIFTGHSLGGSTSTLAAAQFYSTFSEIFPESLPSRNQIKVVTFSAPCVGDEDFASHIGQIFGSNLIRFTSNLDIVPTVPIWGSQAGDEIKILFLEQTSDKFSSAKDKFNQPGFQPKFEVIKDELIPFGSFIFQIGKTGFQVGKTVGGKFKTEEVIQTGIEGLKIISTASKIVLTVSHRVPDIETLFSAFFHYKLRNSIAIEGTEMLDDSQILKPGQVGVFDSVRNPIVRAFLSLFGGYSY